MELVWLVDRASGLLAYAALYLAVVTGVFYNARDFGWLTAAARRTHVEVSMLALALLALHGVVGALDTWFVVSGETPAPPGGTDYLLVGVAVGVGALLVLVVAVLGFVDARRFDRPWSPKVVHGLAYVGFAFATVHAAAVGTDVAGLVRPALVGGGSFVVYALLLRTLRRQGVVSADRSGQ
ncbi:hypothetical protein ACKVMT_08545 [Halobacteriales archaeon Cl-PHB]